MTQPPTGPRDQYPGPGQFPPGYGPPPAAPPGPPDSALGYRQPGPGQQGLGHQGPPQRPPARPAPPLGAILALLVGALGLLSVVWGFLPSSTLTRGADEVLPLGSVFAVVGWAPALLLLSGLLAAATLLPGVDKKTIWLISAAGAVVGGLGGLFFLWARPGRSAGLAFFATNGSAGFGESLSAGLILLVIFGLIQLAAAVLGFVRTSGTRPPARTRAGHYSPAPQRHAAQGYGPQSYAPQGFGPQSSAPQGFGPQSSAPQGFGPQSSAPQGFGPQSSAPQSYGPLPGGYPGVSAAGQTPVPGPFRPSASSAAGVPQQAPPPPMPPAPPPPVSHFAPSPTPRPVFDPQTGSAVRTGLTEPTPVQYAAPPPPPMTNIALGPPPDMTPPATVPPAVGGPGPDEQSDYPNEPVYSEAPDYEERADQEVAAAAVAERQRRAFLYETPEWERPQFEPPQIDSGRHAGWYPEGEDDPVDPVERREPGDGSGWRSIPRAE